MPGSNKGGKDSNKRGGRGLFKVVASAISPRRAKRSLDDIDVIHPDAPAAVKGSHEEPASPSAAQLVSSDGLQVVEASLAVVHDFCEDQVVVRQLEHSVAMIAGEVEHGQRQHIPLIKNVLNVFYKSRNMQCYIGVNRKIVITCIKALTLSAEGIEYCNNAIFEISKATNYYDNQVWICCLMLYELILKVNQKIPTDKGYVSLGKCLSIPEVYVGIPGFYVEVMKNIIQNVLSGQRVVSLVVNTDDINGKTKSLFLANMLCLLERNSLDNEEVFANLLKIILKDSFDSTIAQNADSLAKYMQQLEVIITIIMDHLSKENAWSEFYKSSGKNDYVHSLLVEVYNRISANHDMGSSEYGSSRRESSFMLPNLSDGERIYSWYTLPNGAPGPRSVASSGRSDDWPMTPPSRQSELTPHSRPSSPSNRSDNADHDAVPVAILGHHRQPSSIGSRSPQLVANHLDPGTSLASGSYPLGGVKPGVTFNNAALGSGGHTPASEMERL
jgi:hypothetical protein